MNNCNCSACKYSEVVIENKELVCKRNAPLPVMSIEEDPVLRVYAYWPIVFPNDWCGEFKEKDE